MSSNIDIRRLEEISELARKLERIGELADQVRKNVENDEKGENAPDVEGYVNLRALAPEPTSLEEGYAQHVLIWMLEHNASLTDLVYGIARHLSENLIDVIPEFDRRAAIEALRRARSEFEADEGFDGQVYPTFPEWLDSEDSARTKKIVFDEGGTKTEEEEIIENGVGQAADRTDFDIDDNVTGVLPVTWNAKEDIEYPMLSPISAHPERSAAPKPPKSAPDGKTSGEDETSKDEPEDIGSYDFGKINVNEMSDDEVEEEVSHILSMLEPGKMPRKTLADNAASRKELEAKLMRKSPVKSEDDEDVKEAKPAQAGFSLPSQRKAQAPFKKE